MGAPAGEGGSCKPVRELSLDDSPRWLGVPSAATDIVGYSTGPSAGPYGVYDEDGKVRHTFATHDSVKCVTNR
jgi:hypothetical protein